MNDTRDSYGRRAHAYKGSGFREAQEAMENYAAFLRRAGVRLTGRETFSQLQQMMIDWARKDSAK